MKAILSVLILCFSVYFVAGQTTPKEKLNGAIYLEEVNGELEQAIEVYKTIVKDFPNEREIAAKAQLHIGLCYEKLGKQQATQAYNKVIEQFADQQQTAEIAKTRLSLLKVQNTLPNKLATNKPLIKQIPLELNIIRSGYRGDPFDFSPDCKKFVFNNFLEKSEKSAIRQSRLFVSDVSGTPVNPLLDSSSFRIEANAIFSPDGKYILFVGVKEWGRFYVVDSDGGKPRPINTNNGNNPGGYLGKIWHPDSKHVTYLDSTGIVTINLYGDTTNIFSMNHDNSTRLTGYSPDGKWISYYTRNRDLNNRSDFDVWLVSSKGNKYVRLTEFEGFDGYGTWSEKDYSFYFVSERNGDQNIFRININPETGEKIGDEEQITFYYDADVFSPKFVRNKSTLVYGLQKTIRQIVIPENENFDSFKVIASGINPVFSPDGETVYFCGVGKNNMGIYSVPRLGGMKKRLTDINPHLPVPIPEFRNYLSPDGSAIAFFTETEYNQRQLCFLSVNGGKLLKSVAFQSQEVIVPTWSPDSKKVAFVANNILYTIPAWENKAEILTDKKVGDWESFILRWSPDGKYIAGLVFMEGDAFNKDGDGFNNSVVIVSVKTGEIKRITPKEQWEYKQSIEWYPDSKKLAYMYYDPNKDADGIWEAYVDGSPATEMINQPDVWDYIGAWDPTGENYYFVGDVQNDNKIGPDLFVYDTETKKINSLIYLDDYSLPNFSKDGKYIVLGKRTTENQLWMMEGVE